MSGHEEKSNMMSSFSYFGGFGLGRFSFHCSFFFFLVADFVGLRSMDFLALLFFLFLMIGVHLEDIYTHSLGTVDILEGIRREGGLGRVLHTRLSSFWFVFILLFSVPTFIYQRPFLFSALPGGKRMLVRQLFSIYGEFSKENRWQDGCC